MHVGGAGDVIGVCSAKIMGELFEQEYVLSVYGGSHLVTSH